MSVIPSALSVPLMFNSLSTFAPRAACLQLLNCASVSLSTCFTCTPMFVSTSSHTIRAAVSVYVPTPICAKIYVSTESIRVPLFPICAKMSVFPDSVCAPLYPICTTSIHKFGPQCLCTCPIYSRMSVFP